MRYFTALSIAAALVTPTPILLAEQATARVSTQASASPQNLPANKGLIEQGTYKNPSIGLEFTPAESLGLQEPEMRGTIATVRALDRGWTAGLLSARSLTVFYAEPLANYSERGRNSASYMRKVINAQEANGLQQVGSVRSDQMSGIQFSRADFTKGRVYEVVLMTTHNGYVLVFIFTGSRAEVTNALIASTKVKFTP